MTPDQRRYEPPTPIGTPARDYLVNVCARIGGHPQAPATVALYAQIRRPFLRLFSRVSWGPTGVEGWRVRWVEPTATGGRTVAYLVTESGATYALRPGGGTRALYSDPNGFPPQPNPVTMDEAYLVEHGLEALVPATETQHWTDQHPTLQG